MKLKTLATPINGCSWSEERWLLDYNERASHPLKGFRRMWPKYEHKSVNTHTGTRMHTPMNIHTVREREAQPPPSPSHNTCKAPFLNAEPGNMFLGIQSIVFHNLI